MRSARSSRCTTSSRGGRRPTTRMARSRRRSAGARATRRRRTSPTVNRRRPSSPRHRSTRFMPHSGRWPSARRPTRPERWEPIIPRRAERRTPRPRRPRLRWRSPRGGGGAAKTPRTTMPTRRDGRRRSRPRTFSSTRRSISRAAAAPLRARSSGGENGTPRPTLKPSERRRLWRLCPFEERPSQLPGRARRRAATNASRA
mmetsp:Transcript_17376/g.61761  ORF Transcript_17376/g.61761 Transcript_17376/m.61761 type:complete len:201 (+) Transcript_17376:630-1232(+)